MNEAGLRQTQTFYDDIYRKVTVKNDLLTFGDGLLQTATHYDQLGRVRRVRKSDGTALNESGDSDGIKADTKYYYFAGDATSAGWRRVITTTPYRNLATESTLEWTCTQYDQLGRVEKVDMFRGSVEPVSCDATGGLLTGITATVYDGPTTTVSTGTENEPKTRMQRRDALGRMVEIREDPDGPKNYSTGYDYDALDNLIGVTQIDGGTVQIRTFLYSSLSRVKSATNPESGQVTYSYNNGRDLIRRIDARNAVTAMTYDPMHRIVSKTYSGTVGAPGVTYEYYLKDRDSVPSTTAPMVGRLKKMTTEGVAETAYGSYDGLGNVLASAQIITGHPGSLQFAYTWYPNGALKTEMYPSGRLVNYWVDNAGRTNKVFDGTRTYADLTPSAQVTNPFTADGRIAQMKLGTSPLWAYYDYRPPGETTYYRLGRAPGWDDVLKLEYNFDGNGNRNIVNQVTIRDNNSNYRWEQNFQYDEVNRLSSAAETGSGWSQSYTYDRWGNRAVTSTGLVNGEDISASAYDGSNNRFTSATGADYDAAGNLTDYGTADLTYDGESRTTAVTIAGSGSVTFAYDGDGRRVKKTWNPNAGSPVTTYYAYDALGRLAAEYSNESLTTGTSWIFSDMLGSVRAVTSETGTVVECNDYLPFGAALTSADNGRSAVGCYLPQSNSRTPQKFTGKERDAETGLDYLLARYFSSPQGRFTSPDEPFADQSVSDPQSWNLYSYVRNNPIIGTDPTGRFRWVPTTPGGIPLDFWLDWLERQAVTEQLAEMAQKAQEIVKPALQATFDWISAPRDPGCMAGHIGSYGAAGAAGGAAIGAWGFAGGPVGVVTTPGGAGLGALAGYSAGAIGGMTACMKGSGRGGAGGSSSNPKQWKKLSGGEIESLKAKGIDVHRIKPDPPSRFDLFKDPDGNIYVRPKGSSHPGDWTGLNIKEFIK